MTEKSKSTMPSDGRGWTPDGSIWNGETQAQAFTDTVTAATLITVPGRWFRFFATATCHINIGTLSVYPAAATTEDACYPVEAGVWSDPVYVPTTFDTEGDGTGSLYFTVIRNAADGTLYIAQYGETEGTRTLAVSTTSMTTTTTTTSTTTTTTTTTSTTTTTTTTTSTTTTTTTTTSTTT